MKQGCGKQPGLLRSILMILLWAFSGANTPVYNQDFIIDDVNLRPLNGRIAQTIFKDDLGFIWIGSNAGLFRYDGFDVKSFFNITNDSTSISANHVHSICQDDDGIMWMGTLAGGLCRFDPKTEAFRSFQADPDDETSISNNNIFGLDIDQDGNIWMATNGGGISILPASEKSKPNPKFETLEILAGTRLFSIMVDSRNCFWTGVTDGSIIKGHINRKDLKASKIEREYDCAGPGDSPQRGNFIYDIAEDEAGNVWVATTRYGVKKISPGSLEMQHCGLVNPGSPRAPENYITSLEAHPYGFLLLGTERGGYQLRETVSGAFEIELVKGTEDYQVSSAYMDREENLWVALSEGRIKKLTLNRNVDFVPTNTGKDALQGKWVKSLVQAPNGRLWLGTWINGGLFEWDVNPSEKPEQSEIIRLLQEGLDVAQLYLDPDQELWISTFDDGLLRWKYGEERPGSVPVATETQEGLSSSFVQGVIKDPYRKGYWIGTEKGLDYYDPQAQYWEHYKQDPSNPGSLSDNRIQSNAMVFDADNRLWLGTWGGGVNCLLPGDTTFRVWKTERGDPRTIPKNEVTSLLVDHSGALWVGTFEGGLAKAIARDSAGLPAVFRRFSISDGLPGNRIFSLVEDQKGRIWGSTNFGLFSIDSTYTIRSFDKEDGIGVVDFFFCGGQALEDGRIAFGGTFGMIVFHPDSLISNHYKGNVVLTDFSIPNSAAVMDSSITYQKEITLSHPDNAFTIGFSELNFQQYNYRNFIYKLSGVDEDWNRMIGQNQVTYLNLPYGEFTFEVFSGDRSGEGRQLKVKVIPPWWKSRPFQFLVVLVGLILPFLLVLLRNRNVRLQNTRLEAKINQRTEEIEELNELLQKQNDELEKQVEARTQALEENNRSLMQKNAEMERFNYIASHDLKEPLRNISSFAGLLSRYLPNPKAEALEYLQIIQSNAKRMNTLIEDLLEYSRLANVDHLKERVDLHAVLEEVSTLVREGDPAAGRIVATEKLPVITGNKTQLFLLFKNLISNGLKYNSAPDPEVQLSYEKSSCWHILKFADNGIGIEPQYQQKVFEMFTRLHDRSKYEGSGLGLAICRNIVHRHNGTIELESQIGNGSVFTVKLPVVGEEG